LHQQQTKKIKQKNKINLINTKSNKQSNCIIYSYGISSDTTFESEIYKKSKCSIHAFDPTIGSLPIHLRRNLLTGLIPGGIDITFHKQALTTESGINSKEAV